MAYLSEAEAPGNCGHYKSLQGAPGGEGKTTHLCINKHYLIHPCSLLACLRHIHLSQRNSLACPIRAFLHSPVSALGIYNSKQLLNQPLPFYMEINKPFFFFRKKEIISFSPCWPWIPSVAKDAWPERILLPLFLKCWDYSLRTSHLACKYLTPPPPFLLFWLWSV